MSGFSPPYSADASPRVKSSLFGDRATSRPRRAGLRAFEQHDASQVWRYLTDQADARPVPAVRRHDARSLLSRRFGLCVVVTADKAARRKAAQQMDDACASDDDLHGQYDRLTEADAAAAIGKDAGRSGRQPSERDEAEAEAQRAARAIPRRSAPRPRSPRASVPRRRRH